MRSYILAIDQGTTSSRVLVIDKNLKVVDHAQREFEQITPRVGWVEHDPEKIWESVVTCLQEMRKKHDLSSANVKAIGITNQRETTVAFSRSTGKPYHNALVWLDQRTSSVVNEMKEKNGGNVDAYRLDCGLPINTYFSAVKMRWLLQNAQLDHDDLVLGTVDTWLLAKLT